MQKYIHAAFIIALSVLLPAAVFAAASSYSVVSGDTLTIIAGAHHLSVAELVSYNPQIKNINLIYPTEVVSLSAGFAAPAFSLTQFLAAQQPKVPVAQPMQAKTKTQAPQATQAQISNQAKPISTVVNGIAASVPAVAAAAGEMRFVAYTTGYGWPDNTPKGSTEISNPIIHSDAGGTGTYADPVTVAVGHSISGNTDTLDYPAGTKFYVPNLRKYFIVEDTCGDGNTPQNGPCHSGYQGHPWLDLWVGGNSTNQSATLVCEDDITDLHLVIQNPASTYAVSPGDVASTCNVQFGDTVVSQ